MKPKKWNSLAASKGNWFAVSSDFTSVFISKKAVKTLTPDYKLDKEENIFKPCRAK